MAQSTKIFVPRITKLNACELDREIHNLLKNSLLEIGTFLRPGFLNNFKLEIDLLVKLLVFKHSVLKSNSTFGQQLLNVKYHEKLSTQKASWFAIMNYALPYVKNKLDNFMLNKSNSVLRKVLHEIEIFVKVCHFVNLLIFLRYGTFPNLVDRLLKVVVVPQRVISRNVCYNYMTRELIWHGFMELLVYVLPLINYHGLRKWLVNIFHYKSHQHSNRQEPALCTLNTQCCICEQLPIHPCRISLYCGHIACYYCIKSNILADSRYCCPACGVKNTAGEYLQFLSE